MDYLAGNVQLVIAIFDINKAKNLIIKITHSFTLACDYGYSA